MQTWKGTHRWGIVAGMCTGTVVTIVWKLFLKKPTGVYELIPAFAASAAAIVVVSLACGHKRPSPEARSG